MPEKKHEPLFEPIRMEPIEVDPIEASAENKVALLTKGEVALLLGAYLLVFIGNGVITIPLLLAIPEVLLNISDADFGLILPCLMGTIGLLLAGYRFMKESPNRMQATIVQNGLGIMLGSLFFFLGISESGAVTFISAVPLVALYLYLNYRAVKI